MVTKLGIYFGFRLIENYKCIRKLRERTANLVKRVGEYHRGNSENHGKSAADEENILGIGRFKSSGSTNKN